MTFRQLELSSVATRGLQLSANKGIATFSEEAS
jgi:hypothetical protein